MTFVASLLGGAILIAVTFLLTALGVDFDSAATIGFVVAAAVVFAMVIRS